MNTLNRKRARRVVENLRSGVPSPQVAADFSMGREQLLRRVEEGIENAVAGEPGGVVLQANYGEGKTHTLHAIWNMATSKNCVVSLASLSKETTLDRPDRLYAKLVANTYLPNSYQPGLDQLIASYHPGHRNTDHLLSWVEKNLHPKVAAVLRNRLQGQQVSAESLYKLDQDLAGIAIAQQELKAIHRLNFGETLKISPLFRVKANMFDYFLLLERLIRLAGFRAWVILLDEAELIGRLGRGGRAVSYAMLARLLGYGGQDQPRLASTYTVVAVSSNFQPEVLETRGDTAVAPEWLLARGRVEEAYLAREAIQALGEAELLPSLTEDQLLPVMEQILVAHKTAYGWEPGISGRDLLQRVRQIAPSADAKLRTRIRIAIQWLDLCMQYDEEPNLIIDSLVEQPIEEVASADEEADSLA